MALGGAITWRRGAEFSRMDIFFPVVVGIDEIKADDSRAVTEDYRRLFCEQLVEGVVEVLW